MLEKLGPITDKTFKGIVIMLSEVGAPRERGNRVNWQAVDKIAQLFICAFKGRA